MRSERNDAVTWSSRLVMGCAIAFGQSAMLVACASLLDRFWDPWSSSIVRGGWFLLVFGVAPLAAFVTVRWVRSNAKGISWGALVVVGAVDLGLGWFLVGVLRAGSMGMTTMAMLFVATSFAAGFVGTFVEATARVRKVAVALSLLAASWWLFGFEVGGSGDYTYIFRRVLGPVTRIHVFSKEWLEVERTLFSWSEPFRNAHYTTDCGMIFPEIWRDSNEDGRWDTWLRRVGPDENDHCQVEYNVDTDEDGVADWTFLADYFDYGHLHQTVSWCTGLARASL